MVNSITNRCLLFVLLCGVLSPLLAQEVGEAVRIQGAMTEDVYAAGGTVDVLATVEGSAIIDGNLVFRSPREVEIASVAKIHGTNSYEPVERQVGAIVAAVAGAGIVVLLSLIVTGSALFLIFPRFVETAETTIRTESWKCLGLGLAVFAATPVVIGVLFMTVIARHPDPSTA